MVQRWIQMNIPKIAIEPFEPLGIPTLGILKYASVESLDEAFTIMNRHGENNDDPMSIDAIYLFLFQCIRDAGAHKDSIHINIDIDIESDNNLCYIDIYYMKLDGKLYKFNRTVQSNAGFGLTRR